MPVTVVATPNAANANSFLTVVEADAYWATRVPFNTAWDDADDKGAMVVAATRMINATIAPRREFVPPSAGQDGYFITYPTWTGAAATTTQSLPWGRSGMQDRNGNAIPLNVIPQELKDATAELAGQLAKADRLVDNDVAVQGLTSVKAGSVALAFKQNITTLKVLPDVVFDLLVQSWLTDQIIEGMYPAQLNVIS